MTLQDYKKSLQSQKKADDLLKKLKVVNVEHRLGRDMENREIGRMFAPITKTIEEGLFEDVEETDKLSGRKSMKKTPIFKRLLALPPPPTSTQQLQIEAPQEEEEILLDEDAIAEDINTQVTDADILDALTSRVGKPSHLDFNPTNGHFLRDYTIDKNDLMNGLLTITKNSTGEFATVPENAFQLKNGSYTNVLNKVRIPPSLGLHALLTTSDTIEANGWNEKINSQDVDIFRYLVTNLKPSNLKLNTAGSRAGKKFRVVMGEDPKDVFKNIPQEEQEKQELKSFIGDERREYANTLLAKVDAPNSPLTLSNVDRNILEKSTDKDKIASVHLKLAKKELVLQIEDIKDDYNMTSKSSKAYISRVKKASSLKELEGYQLELLTFMSEAREKEKATARQNISEDELNAMTMAREKRNTENLDRLREFELSKLKSSNIPSREEREQLVASSSTSTPTKPLTPRPSRKTKKSSK